MLMMKMMLRPMSPEEDWRPDEVDEDDDDEGPMNLFDDDDFHSTAQVSAQGGALLGRESCSAAGNSRSS